MKLLDDLKTLLENPFFDTLANFIKKFKSSKSFYSIFYFLVLFTTQQAIAWKYGTAISKWFESLGEEWYYQLGAFIFEHGSIELVVLGIMMLVILALVEILKGNENSYQGKSVSSKGNNYGIINTGDNTIIKQIIYQALGEDTQQEIVESIASQIITHFDSIYYKLDNLSDNKELVDYLMNEIKKAQQKHISIQQQLEKVEKKRQQALEDLNELQIKNNQNNYSLVLNKAQKALENYDEVSYRQYLNEYQSNKDIQETIENYANTFYLKAQSYLRSYEYRKAKNEIEKAIKFDENNPKYINLIAIIYSELGEAKKALPYNKKLLKLTISTKGATHTDTAIAYNNLGQNYSQVGDYDNAIECFEKDIDINKMYFDKNHFKIAMAYNNLGITYQHQGNCLKALRYLLKAHRVLKDKDPYLMRTSNDLGQLYYHLNKNIKALKYTQEALEIAEALYTNKTLDLAIIYDNLGKIYKSINFQKSIDYYTESLKIKISIVGENNSIVATTYHNFGCLYRDNRILDKASYYLDKALSIGLKTFGDNHPKTAVFYFHRGILYDMQGDLIKAIECFENALNIRVEKFGINHPKTTETQKVLNNLKKRLK